MEVKNNLPHLFLNRVNLEGTKCIKLFFYDNEAIRQRISQNEWIQYTMELGAWYAVDYSNTIALIQDLFEDIAYVNLSKLDWKKVEVSRNNIGSPANFRDLKLRNGFEVITLFPYEMEGRPLTGFKHHFNRKHYVEVIASGYFKYHKANRIWEIKASVYKLFEVLVFLSERYAQA